MAGELFMTFCSSAVLLRLIATGAFPPTHDRQADVLFIILSVAVTINLVIASTVHARFLKLRQTGWRITWREWAGSKIVGLMRVRVSRLPSRSDCECLPAFDPDRSDLENVIAMIPILKRSALDR